MKTRLDLFLGTSRLILKAHGEYGATKYGDLDWDRFVKDGPIDNLHSRVRHMYKGSGLSYGQFMTEIVKGLHPVNVEVLYGKYEKESGSHHLTSEAFRCLMQVMFDNLSK